ncbi:triokinase/FMN cyclase-like isoform X2 [Halictus rubicundus]|uniref:triokinase/FMN cyclase-like isoform X2 n=1 Tax=Halictus rubicundus TaxID=77578 RepID=UPI00403599EA
MSELLIDNSLLGIAAVHNGLITLQDCQAVLRRDYTNMIGKVKLISGGRGGCELPCAEFVGPGMLTAAVLGHKTAPPKNNILRVIEEIGLDESSGILLIIPNYAAYPINFTWAKLRAIEKGYNVKMVLVTMNFELATEEQCFLATQFLYKIAGAMSEEGKHIDEIYSFCNHLVNSKKLQILKTDLTEYTFEPFVSSLISVFQDKCKESLRNTNKYFINQEIAILINNYGSTHLGIYTFILDVLKQIEMCGLQAKRIYIKPLLKISDTKCFDICVLNLSLMPVLIKYLDFPTSAPAWPRILTSDILGITDHGKITLCTPGKYCKDSPKNTNLQGPSMCHETGKKFMSIILTACEAVIACTNQLNKLDQEYGKGDYGTNLTNGAQALKEAIQENKILSINPCVAFMQISHIIERTIDDIQGGLYSLFFHNIAKAFSTYETNKQITANMWLDALATANEAIKELDVPSISDHIFVAVLTAIQLSLTKALNENVDPIAAFGAAVKAAEYFTVDTKFKSPCPDAHAVGIWMRAACEAAKLKLINYNVK